MGSGERTIGLEPEEMPFLERAVALALAAEAAGNLPIAAVLVLDARVVAEGVNRTRRPTPHPGRHAEVAALAALPEELVARLGEMTCYTTLEPCLMCFGSLVLHGVGRVVYGARDPRGGGLAVLPHLPREVARRAAPMVWQGPVWPEVCDPLFARAAATYWQGGASA
jgi:tRNA(adenine34) deaminase